MVLQSSYLPVRQAIPGLAAFAIWEKDMATSLETKDLRALRRVMGQELRTLRRQRKMTLDQLSRKVGLRARQLDLYELGRSAITLEHFVRIKWALSEKHVVLKQSVGLVFGRRR